TPSRVARPMPSAPRRRLLPVRLLLVPHPAGFDPGNNFGESGDQLSRLRDRHLDPDAGDGPAAPSEDHQFDALAGALFVQVGTTDLDGFPKATLGCSALDPLLHRHHPRVDHQANPTSAVYPMRPKHTWGRAKGPDPLARARPLDNRI